MIEHMIGHVVEQLAGKSNNQQRRHQLGTSSAMRCSPLVAGAADRARPANWAAPLGPKGQSGGAPNSCSAQALPHTRGANCQTPAAACSLWRLQCAATSQSAGGGWLALTAHGERVGHRLRAKAGVPHSTHEVGGYACSDGIELGAGKQLDQSRNKYVSAMQRKRGRGMRLQRGRAGGQGGVGSNVPAASSASSSGSTHSSASSVPYAQARHSAANSTHSEAS